MYIYINCFSDLQVNIHREFYKNRFEILSITISSSFFSHFKNKETNKQWKPKYHPNYYRGETEQTALYLIMFYAYR